GELLRGLHEPAIAPDDVGEDDERGQPDADRGRGDRGQDRLGPIVGPRTQRVRGHGQHDPEGARGQQAEAAEQAQHRFAAYRPPSAGPTYRTYRGLVAEGPEHGTTPRTIRPRAVPGRLPDPPRPSRAGILAASSTLQEVGRLLEEGASFVP